MRNENPLAPNDDMELRKMRKEVLWGLFEEHRAHARHTETLRSAVINMLIVASAVLVTISTYDKQGIISDILAAFLLVVFGIFGAVFSVYHTEKIAKQNMRATAYRNELDSTVLENPKGRELASIDNRAEDAFSKLLSDRAAHDKSMQLIVKTIRGLDPSTVPRSLLLWSVLPLFISLIGLIIGSIALLSLLPTDK